MRVKIAVLWSLLVGSLIVILTSPAPSDRVAMAQGRIIGETVEQVVASGKTTCALTTKGAVKCWGSNDFGALGDGFSGDRTQPVTVAGLSSGVTSIHGSYRTYLGSTFCAILENFSIRCWGREPWTSAPNLVSHAKPVEISGLSIQPTSVLMGLVDAICAVEQAVAMECWGATWNDGRRVVVPPTRMELPNERIQQVSAVDGRNLCATSLDGRTMCASFMSDWNISPKPQWTVAAENVRQVSGHCYVSTSDELFCFNRYSSPPTNYVSLANGVSMVSAMDHWQTSCAALSTGGALCWGRNPLGQVGDGTTTRRETPVPVVGLDERVRSFSLNEWSSCAILDSDVIRCWGNDDDPGIEGAVSIATGATHRCAVTAIGGVKCWGENTEGQLGDRTRKMRELAVDVVGFARYREIKPAPGSSTTVTVSTVESPGSSTTVQSVSSTTVARGPKWRPKKPRGGVSVLVNGKEIDAKFEFSSRSVRVTTPNVEMTVAEATDDETLNPDDSESLDWTVDEEIDVAVDGLEPGSDVDLTMFSDPVPLHSGVAGEDGRAALKIRVPSGVSPGAHSLVIDGTISDGTAITMVVSVVVSSAVTAGSRWTGFALAALVLAVLGALSLPASRLRRRRSRVQP